MPEQVPGNFGANAGVLRWRNLTRVSKDTLCQVMAPGGVSFSGIGDDSVRSFDRALVSDCNPITASDEFVDARNGSPGFFLINNRMIGFYTSFLTVR